MKITEQALRKLIRKATGGRYGMDPEWRPNSAWPGPDLYYANATDGAYMTADGVKWFRKDKQTSPASPKQNEMLSAWLTKLGMSMDDVPGFRTTVVSLDE